MWWNTKFKAAREDPAHVMSSAPLHTNVRGFMRCINPCLTMPRIHAIHSIGCTRFGFGIACHQRTHGDGCCNHVAAVTHAFVRQRAWCESLPGLCFTLCWLFSWLLVVAVLDGGFFCGMVPDIFSKPWYCAVFGWTHFWV